MNRARLTITDLLYIVVAIAGLVALYPAYSAVLSSTVGQMSAGAALLFQTVLPVALIILLSVIYVEARRGAA